MPDQKQNAVKYGEVIAKCWEDEAYKKRFLENPESVLTEAGFAIEEGVTYKVVEQPKLVKYMVLPHDKVTDAMQVISKGLLNRVEQQEHFIPEGAELRIIQNTEDIRHLVLPASPKTLTQADLKLVAGGDSAKVTENVVLATNGAAVVEGVAVVVEAQALSTSNVATLEADAVGVVVIVGIAVLI